MEVIVKKISVILFLTIAFAASVAIAQQTRVPLSLGIYGGLNINMHNPYFTDYEGSDYQPYFVDNANSITPNIGLIAYIPINNTFVFSPRIGYNPMNSNLPFSQYWLDEFELLPFDVSTSMQYLEISPIMQFHNLLNNIPIHFLAGLELGLPIRKKYDFTNLGYFVPDEMEYTGDVPDANLRAAIALGAGYIIPIGKKTHLTPEISFRFPVTQVSADELWQKWSISQLRLGVNLTFSLEKDYETPPPPPVPGLEVGFKDVRYYNPDGTTAPLQFVKVEDVQYTELFPFVPYMFLDENTVEPNSKQQVLIGKTESGEFTIQKLEPDAVKINSSTLDVIGSRMQENPTAELTIIGTLDGRNEKTNKDLALNRAIYAKDYLIENYDINPQLINVRGGDLPSKPSTSKVEDGIAENRRVEFQSSNPNLFQPILIESDNQRIAEPQLIEIIPYAISDDDISFWNLEIAQSDRVLRNINEQGEPKPVQWSIRPNELTNRQVPIDYRFTATTTGGITKTATGTIPIEYISFSKKKTDDLPDRIVSKYSLILFDFDKAEVSAADRKIIDEHIIPAIKFNSNIRIYGYTDRIGDEKYNQNLATKRAEAVKNYIVSKKKDVKIETIGVGETVPIFNNDLPIGRHLSRTVQVHIITPK